MTHFRQLQVAVSAILLSLGLSTRANAQIFNPPTPQPNAQVQQAAGTTAQAGEVKQTAWSGIPVPKITMPKITMPKVKLPSMTTVVAPVKSGFQKVSTGTKKAWEGTKEIFTLGKQQPQAASTQPKTPWWRKLVTPAPEPDGPQTVAEWMKQPRLDP